MDTLEPPPTPVLLSAEEAKARLREIVEGFFFRRLKGEDGKHIRRLLVKSPPGLGKTREAIDWAVTYQAEQQGKGPRDLLVADQNEAGVPSQTSIFVPRHQLAEELKEIIERAFEERGEPIAVPILRGRENGGEKARRPAGGGARPVRWRARGCRSTPTFASAGETAGRSNAPTLLGASTSRRGRPLMVRHLSSWCIPISAWSGARLRPSAPSGRQMVRRMRRTTARSARGWTGPSNRANL